MSARRKYNQKVSREDLSTDTNKNILQTEFIQIYFNYYDCNYDNYYYYWLYLQLAFIIIKISYQPAARTWQAYSIIGHILFAELVSI